MTDHGTSHPGQAVPRAATVSLFGHTVELDIATTFQLPPAHGRPGLRVGSRRADPVSPGSPEVVYRSSFHNPDGAPVLRVMRDGEDSILDFPGCAKFHVASDRIQVTPCPGTDERIIDIRLFGVVIAYWLEHQRITTLHASAIATDRGALVFLSSNGGGKTALAAAMMRRGHELLTDDLLAVSAAAARPLAHSGYPQMRMWPELASHFVDDWRSRETVHPGHEKLRIPVGQGGFGRFHRGAVPIQAIYLPVRSARQGAPVIADIRPAEGIRALLAHGFIPRLQHLTRDPRERLGALAAICERVPIRTVHYADDLGQLDRTCELIAKVQQHTEH